MKHLCIAFALLAGVTANVCASAGAIPAAFESVASDRSSIEVLLDTYAKAVSTKNQALFETLLLDKMIPFSDVDSAVQTSSGAGSTSRYASFAQAVFHGPAFTQRFQDIHISQDGLLANVTLVFVNTTGEGSSWGWKTLQLLKVRERWKIASEFYTGHAG